MVHPDDPKQEVKEPYETVEELQSPLKEPAESTAQDEDTMQQQQLVDNDPSTTSQSQLTDVESLIAQWVTDPECVKEILEDFRNFPPQHKRRDPKGVYHVVCWFQYVLLFVCHIDVNYLDWKTFMLLHLVQKILPLKRKVKGP